MNSDQPGRTQYLSSINPDWVPGGYEEEIEIAAVDGEKEVAEKKASSLPLNFKTNYSVLQLISGQDIDFTGKKGLFN